MPAAIRNRSTNSDGVAQQVMQRQRPVNLSQLFVRIGRVDVTKPDSESGEGQACFTPTSPNAKAKLPGPPVGTLRSFNLMSRAWLAGGGIKGICTMSGAFDGPYQQGRQ